MHFPRSSGMLLHISSLPGNSLLGTLGQEAYDFVDFLSNAGIKYWQILPFTPICSDRGFSPYDSPSSFAGNELFINYSFIKNSDWFSADIDILLSEQKTNEIDFQKAVDTSKKILKITFEQFIANASGDKIDEFVSYCKKESWWIDDYSLFYVLGTEFNTNDWRKWPEDFRNRDNQVLIQYIQNKKNEIDCIKFSQFIFEKQFLNLKNYCNSKGISIIGDLPIYVSSDSSDTWANPDIFVLDKETFYPTEVAGVPPDYFSPTGQRWGNPVYKWFNDDGSLFEHTLYWWKKRISRSLRLIDIIRIDHFRGFQKFWSVPSTEPTAVNGEWKTGPGYDFFEYIRSKLGDVPIIAEDLGIITPDVEDLRDNLDYPGMKVLQFAFDGDPKNTHLIHNITNTNCVLYTGTHDNDTTKGWYISLGDQTKEIIKKYLHNISEENISWSLISHAFSSTAKLVIIPYQDFANLDSLSRMNLPGSCENNWRWRIAPHSSLHEITNTIRMFLYNYNRL